MNNVKESFVYDTKYIINFFLFKFCFPDYSLGYATPPPTFNGTSAFAQPHNGRDFCVHKLNIKSTKHNLHHSLKKKIYLVNIDK